MTEGPNPGRGRHGLRLKLLSAFGAFVVLGVLTSGLAVAIFDRLGREAESLAIGRLPGLRDADELALTAQQLDGAASDLIAARTLAQLDDAYRLVSERLDRIAEVTARISARSSEADLLAFNRASQDIRSILDLVLQIRADALRNAAEIAEAQGRAESLVDGIEADLAELDLGGLGATIRARAANLLVHLVRLPQIDSRDGIDRIEVETLADAREFRRLLDRPSPGDRVRETADSIMALLDGTQGLFALHRWRIQHAETLALLVGQFRLEAAELAAIAGANAGTFAAAASASATRVAELRDTGRLVMIALALASAALAAFIGWFVVKRGIADRLAVLGRAMMRPRDGVMPETVAVAGNDEIGAMARALEDFIARSNDLAITRAALQREEARLRAVIDHAADGIVTLGIGGEIRSFSPAAEGMFGRSADDVIGTPFDRLVPGFPADGVGDGTFRESLGRRADGREFPVEVAFAEVRGADGVFLTGILRDITRHKQIEQDLRQARDAAESANRAKSEFLSLMSHELRTPLTAVIGYAELLGEENDPPLTGEQQQSTERILAAGRHLLDLINDVLDLARVESGTMAVQVEDFDLVSVLRACHTLARHQGEGAGVTVNGDLDGAQPLPVRGDPVRVQQILINLLSNAVKYNRPDGTVTLRVLSAQPGRVRIGVEDTGIGVPEDRRGELFEPFSRLGLETTGIEGTGIGLALSRRLAAAMDGRLGYETIEGGSRFWLDLPAGRR